MTNATSKDIIYSI